MSKHKKLIIDTSIFILSLAFAWYFLRNGFLNSLIMMVLPLKFVAEFTAGLLYASFLTSPIAIAMIVVLAKSNNPLTLALLAGLGAAVMDLLIIRFLRKNLSQEIDLIARELRFKKINNFLSKWKLDCITPIIGAIIIASPLADELGLLMLGVSKLKYPEIAVLTYILNTAGILLIAIPVNLL